MNKMLLINANYTDARNNIKLVREVADDADLKMVVGEVIYGVEVQMSPEVFATNEQFEKANIPDKFKLNCTVLDESNEDFSLKVTICRKRTK